MSGAAGELTNVPPPTISRALQGCGCAPVQFVKECMHRTLFTCVCVCICMYVCKYVCMSVYVRIDLEHICIYIHM